MNFRQGMQALRIAGFGLAVIAAVVVFIVGGFTDAEAWRTPALLLVGVLVLVLHLSTLPYLESSVSTEERVEYRVEYTTAPAPAPPGAEPAPSGVGSSTVVGSGATGATPPIIPGVPVPGVPVTPGTLLPGVPIPTQAFPDAGRGHAPAKEARSADELPPLHHVLGPEPVPPVTGQVVPATPVPTPVSGGVRSDGAISAGDDPDAVLVDLRSGDGEAHLVYHLIERPDDDPGPAPSDPLDSDPGPQTVPDVPAPPPHDPGGPAAVPGAPPAGPVQPGPSPMIDGQVDPGWAPPDPGDRRQ